MCCPMPNSQFPKRSPRRDMDDAPVPSLSAGTSSTRLARNEGSVSAAAKELDIGQSTLYRRMRELGVEAEK